jgi:sec-independent protein translocase protein TatC
VALARRIVVRRVRPDDQLSVVEHLDELRRRLIIAGLALVVAFAAMYAIHDQLIDFLKRPLPDDLSAQDLITLSPTEPFMVVLKVCFWSALILAVPVWLYQLYAFCIPAVAEQSRRRMLAVVGGVSALFVGGAAFGYFVVLPVALNFLLSFGDGVFTTQVRAGEYFAFCTSLVFASGLLFEVPVAMLALARMGIATADMYRRQWRVAIVVIAAIAAALPGGDPLSMLLLMIPQIALYVLGIWLAKVFGGPPLWSRDAWAGERAEPWAVRPS